MSSAVDYDWVALFGEVEVLGGDNLTTTQFPVQTVRSSKAVHEADATAVVGLSIWAVAAAVVVVVVVAAAVAAVAAAAAEDGNPFLVAELLAFGRIISALPVLMSLGHGICGDSDSCFVLIRYVREMRRYFCTS
jgi:hypothetical protein